MTSVWVLTIVLLAGEGHAPARRIQKQCCALGNVGILPVMHFAFTHSLLSLLKETIEILERTAVGTVLIVNNLL